MLLKEGANRMSKKSLEKAFTNPEKTKSVNFDLDDVEPQEIEGLFDRLAKLPRLESVTLEGQIDELPPAIGKLRQVKRLCVNISEGIATLLPDEIGNMASLEELTIERNFMAVLPDTIGRLSKLRALTIMQTDLRELPQSIGDLAALEELNCSECRLLTLTNEIENLTKLTKLSLDGSFTSIPFAIEKLTSLQELFLCGKFTSAPGGIALLPALSKLYLRGRFEKLDRSYFDGSQPLERLSLANELREFETVSKEKLAKHKSSVPWPVVESSADLLKRPLSNVPLLTSFKIAGLPGEEILIKPSTPANVNAIRALQDGSPLFFVSEAEPDTPATIEGLCQIGVVVSMLECHIYSDGSAELRMIAGERIRILSVKKSPAILLADVDSLSEGVEQGEELALQLKDAALARLDEYLGSIRTPKAKRAQALQKFEEKLPKAISRGNSSFLIGSVVGLSYNERQALLFGKGEVERLRIIGRKLGKL